MLYERLAKSRDKEQIIASTYQLYLPTEEELRQEVATERERIEQAQHLLKEPEKAEEEQVK
jgi:intergrase/recombinase